MILACEECSALVDATLVAHYVVSDEFAPSARFSLSKCPQCESPLLAVQGEDIPSGWQTPTLLYPAEEEGLGHDVPDSIRAAFEEATRCMKARAYTASAIMCRKVAEGVGVAHGVKGRNLAASIKALAEQGILDHRMVEWADHLRLYGNEAAHDVEVQISESEAADLLTFTRAMIEYVFTFQQRFEEFKVKRSAKQAVLEAAKDTEGTDL